MKINHAIVYFHHTSNVWLAISGLHSNFAARKVMCRLASKKRAICFFIVVQWESI